MVPPIASCALPNDRVQSDSLISTTRGPPARSSSALNARPTTGDNPSDGSNPCETTSAARRTGLPCGGAKFTSPPITPSSDASVRLSRLKSRKSGTDAGSRVVPVCRSVSQTITTRSSSATGAAFSSTPSTTLKIAVVAPMARASVAMATAVNAG